MIGAGGIAVRHLEVLAAEPDVSVVGHVAAGLDSARRAANRWGGRAYPTVADLLSAERPDAAWVTVPPHAHGPIEFALIEGRVALFVEKPLSAERWLAREIAAAIARSGLVSAVGYQWRAIDPLDELRAALSDRPPRLVLGAWHGVLPTPAWWRRQALSGGQMVEQATHLLDLARYLVGEARVAHAAAGTWRRAGIEDADVAGVSTAALQFESGALGSFTATSLLAANESVRLQLICDALLVSITREGVSYDRGRERREVRVLSDPIAAVDRAFLGAVRAGNPALVYSSYADALRTHELAFDVQEAAGLEPSDVGSDIR
jgi:myo-inositol 2-dehydrogenase/D-chiro-inositol 1-dehydrogenase